MPSRHEDALVQRLIETAQCYVDHQEDDLGHPVQKREYFWGIARPRTGWKYFHECAELVRGHHHQECETSQTCPCAALANALDQLARDTALWVPSRETWDAVRGR